MSDPRFDWSFPYSSQRMPVMARNVVATSQPLAAQAGLQVLAEGGNAADAAVATAMALTVVEPTSNGIGSDAFALIWKDGRLHGLNASGRSPARMPAHGFCGMDAVPFNGWDPVTVPGAVSGWVETARRFGSVPMERLARFAIEYAEEGFPVSPQTAGSWTAVPRRWPDQPTIQAAFAPGGRTPRSGEWWRFPEQGRTLRRIAETEGEAFYRGDLAAAIARHARETGGTMTEDDLAAHESNWVEPIHVDVAGVRLHEIPPNGQGIAGLQMLGMCRDRGLADLDPDCPDALHVQIEAMKLAFRDARRFVADPDHMDVDPAALIDEGYLASRAALIDPTTAADPGHGEPKRGGTVLLCAADASGMMVSFIQSNYTGFGSGVVVPGTGISLQNRGACFVTEDGHPNQVGPSKRPYHTIIPGFVTAPGGGGVQGDARRPLMAFGVMGGPMQPQGHAQVVLRMYLHGQNPQAALDAPRWQVTEGREVLIEPGFGEDVYEELRRRGHELRVADARTVRFGGGQAIHVLDEGYVAGSDLRRDGQAVGF